MAGIRLPDKPVDVLIKVRLSPLKHPWLLFLCITVFIYSIARKGHRSSRSAAIFVKGLMTQGFLLDDEKCAIRVFQAIALPQTTMRIIREKTLFYYFVAADVFYIQWASHYT